MDLWAVLNRHLHFTETNLSLVYNPIKRVKPYNRPVCLWNVYRWREWYVLRPKFIVTQHVGMIVIYACRNECVAVWGIVLTLILLEVPFKCDYKGFICGAMCWLGQFLWRWGESWINVTILWGRVWLQLQCEFGNFFVHEVQRYRWWHVPISQTIDASTNTTHRCDELIQKRYDFQIKIIKQHT